MTPNGRGTAERLGPGGGPAGRVASQLALAIHEHRLVPGTKPSEDEVGLACGVSRTIVRAAFHHLAHERLITLRRNRGAFVAQPSIRKAREVFEARALLEPRSARPAAERTTPDDAQAIQAHLDAGHAAVALGDAGRAPRLSGRFPLGVARIADQTLIAELLGQRVARSSPVIALCRQRRAALCERHAHDPQEALAP